MSVSVSLQSRCDNTCELCSSAPPVSGFAVSPKEDGVVTNEVAVCGTCNEHIEKTDTTDYWRCLEGAVWNPEPAVQALSYRLLHRCGADWAEQIIQSVDWDEAVVDWAMSAFQQVDQHLDAFGNKLENGYTVVLTENLNVKGTSFSAPKGTVVKKIRLVHDNTDQIEGKINEQTIVILTKFVRKS
ncbi:MAG: PhnA domain-containing protein [Chitinophagales bacterium]